MILSVRIGACMGRSTRIVLPPYESLGDRSAAAASSECQFRISTPGRLHGRHTLEIFICQFCIPINKRSPLGLFV